MLLIAGGTIVYLNRDVLFNASQAADDAATMQSYAGSETARNAETIATTGQADEANRVLDTAIEGTDSVEEKVTLLKQKVANSFATDKATAVMYSRQIAELQPGFVNFSSTAELAEQAGDKATAIEFYEKTISEIDKDTDESKSGSAYSRTYYENKLGTLR